jgi:hypothetical protein
MSSTPSYCSTWPLRFTALGTVLTCALLLSAAESNTELSAEDLEQKRKLVGT